MARISKAEYPCILRMIDGEKRKVAEIAAEYGCTPANIYALLARLRRDVHAHAEAIQDDLPSPHASASAPTPLNPDFFAVEVPTHEPAGPLVITGKRRSPDAGKTARGEGEKVLLERPETKPAAAAEKMTQPSVPNARPAPVAIELSQVRDGKKANSIGASLAKPGMALVMRTAEGEENLTPFRSLDDLLAAVKPILRSAAHSPDAVWFSIQPVDLSLLDNDAA